MEVYDLEKSYIVRADGTVEEVKPKKGKYFQLDEMQAIVGGLIEIVHGDFGFIGVINEEGKINDLPKNVEATTLMRNNLFKGDYIAGDMLFCKSELVK